MFGCHSFVIHLTTGGCKESVLKQNVFDAICATYHHVVFLCDNDGKFKTTIFPKTFGGIYTESEGTQIVDVIVGYCTTAWQKLAHLLDFSGQKFVTYGNTIVSGALFLLSF